MTMTEAAEAPASRFDCTRRCGEGCRAQRNWESAEKQGRPRKKIEVDGSGFRRGRAGARIFEKDFRFLRVSAKKQPPPRWEMSGSRG